MPYQLIKYSINNQLIKYKRQSEMQVAYDRIRISTSELRFGKTTKAPIADFRISDRDPAYIPSPRDSHTRIIVQLARCRNAANRRERTDFT